VLKVVFLAALAAFAASAGIWAWKERHPSHGECEPALAVVWGTSKLVLAFAPAVLLANRTIFVLVPPVGANMTFAIYLERHGEEHVV